MATADGSGTIGERFVELPGGVTVTRRASSQVWSYPNIHGDVAAIADAIGIKSGTTLTYDPYGQPLTAPADNVDGVADWGWVGSAQKLSEPSGVIQMGVRPYLPSLGRFLAIDPIPGGCANDYAYVHGDPVAGFDLTGKQALSCAGLTIANDIGELTVDVRVAKNGQFAVAWGARLVGIYREWGESGMWVSAVKVNGKFVSQSFKGEGSDYWFHGSVAAPKNEKALWLVGQYKSGGKTYTLQHGDTVSIRIAGAAYGGGRKGTVVWTGGVDCEV